MATGTASLPRRIGPYIPIKKLGQGGMGVVYQAQDERDPARVVALKVIIDSGSGGHTDDTARRFLREARILESLRHPNMVSFYEIGVHESKSWFAMELLSGRTLSAYVGQPWPVVVPLFIQVCAGMAYLAARRIVHRDLSPDNIFVIEEKGRRTAKILDFGIAKDTTTEETIHNFTRTGLLMGKPMYWSPEQVGHLEPGEKIDWRSDVYALGIIFHRVLSGELPFHAETPVGYISAHLQERPSDLVAPAGNPPIPQVLMDRIRQMMEKNRADRPAYREVVDAFREALLEAGEQVEELSIELPLEGEITGVTEPWSKRTSPTVTPSTSAGDATELSPNVSLDAEPTALTPVPGAGAATGPTKVPTHVTKVPTHVTKVPTHVTKVTKPTRITSVGGQAQEAAWPEEQAQEPEVQEEEAGPRPRSRLPLVLVAAVILLAVGFGVYKVLQKKVPPPIAKTTGTLILDAVPWAHIVEITNTTTNQKVPVKAEATTPIVLELPPASYQVVLRMDKLTETQTVNVQVAAGETVTKPIALIPAERAVALLD